MFVTSWNLLKNFLMEGMTQLTKEEKWVSISKCMKSDISFLNFGLSTSSNISVWTSRLFSVIKTVRTFRISNYPSKQQTGEFFKQTLCQTLEFPMDSDPDGGNQFRSWGVNWIWKRSDTIFKSTFLDLRRMRILGQRRGSMTSKLENLAESVKKIRFSNRWNSECLWLHRCKISIVERNLLY